MINKEALNILKESDKFTIREIKTALEVAQKALEKQVEIVVKDTGDEEDYEFICPIIKCQDRMYKKYYIKMYN